MVAGGLSFTRADESEEGSGGSLRTPEQFAAVLGSLSMYPEVQRCRLPNEAPQTGGALACP